MQGHNLKCSASLNHHHADDTNVMKTFLISFQYNVLKNEVADCMKQITLWMNNHILKIDPDKTELLLLYPKPWRIRHF